jgi:hypothetical protein
MKKNRVLGGVLLLALLLTMTFLASGQKYWWTCEELTCRDGACGSSVPPWHIGTCMFRCYWGTWYELWCELPEGR